MGNKDLTDCIPWYPSPGLKCVDIPKDGKTKRRERRQQELKRRKGVRNEQKKADRINQKLVEIL